MDYDFFWWVTLTLIYRDPWLTTMPGVTAEGIFPPPPSLRVSATVLRSPFSSPPGESWTIKDGNGWNMSSNGKSLRNCRTKCWFCCLPCLIAGTIIWSLAICGCDSFGLHQNAWFYHRPWTHVSKQTHQNWWLNHKWVPKNMVTAPVRGRVFMLIAFAPMKSIASKTQGFCTFWLKSFMNLENKTL